MYEISVLKQNLQSKLPGKKSQYKMAPSDRAVRDQALNISDLRKSAVLIILFNKNNNLHVLLTQRASYKGPHGGQISFPGGKFEEHKDQNLQSTAIRETYEEIALGRDDYEILAPLSPLFIPISKISVQPFVAFSTNILKAKPDGYELVDLYKVPISILQDPINIKKNILNDLEYPYYDFKGKKIWGATAMMISELLDVL